LVSISNNDDNKVFGISFGTPPRDSTGVAHILEHSVLCGSKKYPLKEPFVELIKGSLNTFLNAFTYPDKTCYPVASQNTQDLYNLADVYMDAVFHPLIDEWTFMQEGWHYETTDRKSPLTRKGVVYNEMKGVYSSPDSLLHEFSQRILFPDSIYGNDSGGDPRVIPSLDYASFSAFRERYYHPSNARIWFWGDDDPGTRLVWLDERLSEFDAKPCEAVIKPQPALTAPRTEEMFYAASPEESNPKAMFTLNWLLPEKHDASIALAFHILEEILIGQAASPVKRALIESGLGEALAGIGLESELRQMYFSVGLRGIGTADIPAAEAIIFETLEALAAGGVPQEIVHAALNTVEFALRERNTGRFPQGLSMMLTALTTWLYSRDPLMLLPFERPLEEIKSRIASREPVFETLIREHFINNPHRVGLRLLPDTGLAERQAHEEATELAEIRAGLVPAEVDRIIATTLALEERQQREDDPAALAGLPSLGVQDLDRETKKLPRGTSDRPDLLINIPETSGIVYVDLAFDCTGMPSGLLPWARTWAHALTEIGTESEDYAAFATRIASETGGIRTSDIIAPTVSGGTTSSLVVRARVLAQNVDKLAAILEAMLLTPRLGDVERLARIVLSRRARIEESLVSSGHLVVDSRVRAMLHPSGAISEAIRGLGEFAALSAAGSTPDNTLLKEIHANLAVRERVTLSITASPGLAESAAKTVTSVLDRLPAQGSWPREGGLPATGAAALALTGPLKVHYVGRGLNMAAAGYKPHGAAILACRAISTGWLWNSVRVQGGAYGAFCRYSPYSGILTMASYRDPNLENTLKRYGETADWLREQAFTGRESERAIIGAIGELDAWQMPDARGFSTLTQHLAGVTDEMRQRQRDEVFSTTKADLDRFAEALADLANSPAMAVFGPEESLQTWAAGAGAKIERLL
ncbi:MAG TPA: insulinase family protein, partial [Spirochaetota bacterium]|nr:insulinase family protein [Spirochaetota bacterium]